MGDRDFGDAASCPRGIDRDEAVHLAMELDAGQRLAPVSLQTAAVIVKLDPVQLRYKPVGNARRELTREPRVFAIFAPAGHDVVSLIQLFKQASDVGRIVLKIRVHRNQYLSTRVIDACAHRGGLSVVAPERNHSNSGILPGDGTQHRYALINRAVVDVDDLIAASEALERVSELCIELFYVVGFVVDRHDYRQRDGRVFAPDLGESFNGVLFHRNLAGEIRRLIVDRWLVASKL